MLDRKNISEAILKSFEAKSSDLKTFFENTSTKGIGYFFIDDLLPEDIAHQIYDVFPSHSDTVLKKSLKEFKHIAVQMDRYNSLLEEVVYAFQDKEVVKIIEEICKISNLQPDDKLYAGGLSMMSKGHFLNPHLDNSHDKDREQWRMLNLLYYVSPDWKKENGGNLELWPEGLKNTGKTILSKFNRLVVMATHNNSWHSVSKVQVDRTRCCVSNYYFSEKPWFSDSKFHVTTFRGRPEEKMKDKLLQTDAFFRNQVRKVFKKGIVENSHVYKKEEE